MSSGQLLEVRPLELFGVDHGNPACRDGLERGCPGTFFEMGALSQEGPRSIFGQALAVVFDPNDPVEDKEDIGAFFALLGQRRPGGELFDLDLLVAHDPGGERANAVSTAVTRASESWSPQGVCRPKDNRYQSLKSVSPDLCERAPLRS